MKQLAKWWKLIRLCASKAIWFWRWKAGAQTQQCKNKRAKAFQVWKKQIPPLTSEPPIDSLWGGDPEMLAQGRKQKAPEQKRKWRCFSTRQHNQFQVTFYINGGQSWLSGRVQGCQPLWPTRPPVHTVQTKAGAAFYSLPVRWRSCRKLGHFLKKKKISAVANRASTSTWTWLWEIIRNHRARESSQVRTQTGSIYVAYCKIRGLSRCTKSGNLGGDFVCTEFIFDPRCESPQSSSGGSTGGGKNQWVAVQHQISSHIQ